MIRLTAAVIAGSLCSAQAIADDMSRVAPTDQQLLSQCIERQMSNSSVTVSKSQAKRYCKDELKRQKEIGAGPERQPVDAPPAAPPASAVPASP